MTAGAKPAVRVKRNVWGNHMCYVGRFKVDVYGREWDAKLWLATKIRDGHPVAVSSEVSAADVASFADYVA